MARSFGSLGDFFPDKDLSCRIRGCNNVWRFSGEEALHSVAEGRNPRPDRMCDECYREFQKLSDALVPCSREGCQGTWVWNRFQQLEALRQGHQGPPKGLCESCRKQIEHTEDREIPCRIRGCTNTWTWRARDQVLHGGEAPQRRLCDVCFTRLKSLQDREVPCRVRSCSHTWLWNRYQQLEHLAAGKSLDAPPKRMCDECYTFFKTLADRELPCKVSGCTRTWTYSAYEQLERHAASPGEVFPDPERMCQDCYQFFLQAVDREERCRNRGCDRTWIYTKSMQLHDHVRGKDRAPVRMCDHCAEVLKGLTDQQVPCMVPGCDGHWLYTDREQLKDQLLGRNTPPAKRCQSCERFLSENSPLTVFCEHCNTPIQWSVYEQLLCSLGTFVKPTQCPACAKQSLALGAPRPAPERPHHHVVKIPAAGRWHEVDRIRDWPKHMTYETITQVEQADIRIVAIGDDLTWSMDDPVQAWPNLLQDKLNAGFEDGRKVAVVNAGIVRCTSEQGVLRFARDVVPFAPDLIIFSFAYADALVRGRRKDGEWRYNVTPEEASAGLEAFVRLLRETGSRLLYWTANPVFPEDARHEDDGEGWVSVQRQSSDHILRLYRQICIREDIPILDLRSRFEVNGVTSAKKWMSGWFMHNEVGADNIATWFAEHLLHSDLLPSSEQEASSP